MIKFCEKTSNFRFPKNKDKMLIFNLLSFVGVKGFEPSTPCSQSRCANRTALRPDWLSPFALQS